MGSIDVKNGQSMIDVTLMLSASVEHVFEIAEENGCSITDNVVGNTMFYSSDLTLRDELFLVQMGEIATL